MERCAIGLRELKFADGKDAAAMSFSGYGAVFGNVDSYGDVIAKGAFRDTLRAWRKADSLPPLLLQHGGWGVTADDLTPIGVWTDKAEDESGLKVEGQLADSVRGREAYALLKMQPRPALDGLSIGYVAKEVAIGTKPEEPRRTLKKIELVEVSLVTFPANPKARVGAVKAADMTEREFERLLVRDAGLSRSEAAVVISRGFKALKAARDAGEGDVSAALERLIATLKRS